MVKVARNIDPAYVKRAQMVEDAMVGPYLDSIIVEMHRALDQWRYGKAPVDELQLATSAFIALLAEAEARGMTS